jgi:coniferyl-aldehyde dehydrogenase
MIKLSELTPRFSEILKKAVAEHFDESEVAVVTGGVEIGRSFSTLPFDHLLFTGSTKVGRIVYQAAAANLTPVTLELGGKSPALVCDDYSIEKAARSIAFGKWVNAGQTCIAPDYVLVPEGKVDLFAEALIAQARDSYPAITGNSDYSSIISPIHRKRLHEAVESAKAAGATVIAHEEEGSGEVGKIGPTLVIGAPHDNLLMREEIFGPVLPIIGYRSLTDAIRHIAERERPLALYAFSRKRKSIRRILGETLSGGVTLNGTLLHVAQEALPFGGVGASGIGAYHGEEGFRRFSHARGVFDPGPINVMERLGPPWGKAAAFISRLLAR